MIKTKTKDLPSIRLVLLKNQSNKCLICQEPLGNDTKNQHVDHDHDTGIIRGVLCMRCNLLEGMMKHKFNRSGLKKTTDYKLWLRNLIVYLDNKTEYYHPSYTTDLVKSFSKLKKQEQIQILNQYEIDSTGKTKAELTKLYKKVLTK